jgi:hypothetical protein
MQALRREIFGKLALFALATQLVLSFGHVHLHGPHAPAAASPASCDAKAPAPANSSCPAHDDDGEQHCSICWTISIAGSIVLAAPAVLQVPRVTLVAPRPPIIVGQLGDASTVKFQARGPPLA